MRVHWSFLALVLVLLSMTGPGGIPLLLLVFGSVFLHELGHSLVAMRFGIRVTDITFWPLGGMARMTEIPENPKVEGAIALAGPAVNFVLAALFGLTLLFSPGAGGAGLFGIGSPTGPTGWAGLARWAIEINLLLGVFNLVPAFPMDGGRVLRAYLALERPWLRATELAVGVGRQLALATILASVIACPISFATGSQFPWTLPLIAGFVWVSGGRELWAVRMRELQKRQASHQSIFDLFKSPLFGGTPGPPSGPPPSSAQRSWVDPDDIEDAEVVEDTHAASAGSNPSPAPGATLDGTSKSSGFSSEEIRNLENFRGRLKRD